MKRSRRWVLFAAWIPALVPAQPAGQPAIEPAEVEIERGPLTEAAAHSVRSDVLGEARPILVWLPPSHAKTSRAYPVVVVLDGDWMFSPVVQAAAHLAATGQMPESVVVGVLNTDRERDFTPPGLAIRGNPAQGGGAFARFLLEELAPALSRTFRAGRPVVLVGHSHSAMFVHWALAGHAGLLDWAVAIDAPMALGEGWLAERLAERAAAAPGSPMRLVSLEARFGWPADLLSAALANKPDSWRLHRERLDGESHESMTMLASYLGLRWLFEDYSLTRDPREIPARTLERLAGLEQAYGAAVYPSARLLSLALEEAIMEGDAARARSAFERLLSGYGEPSDAQRLRARLAQLDALPPITESVQDLLSAPKPDAGAIAPFLGEWTGQEGPETGPHAKVVLRLRVQDGRAAGEFIMNPGGLSEQVSPLEHISVVDGLLRVGYLNGMRPRGVLMRELRAAGDELVGLFHMRGINFQLPAGRTFPPSFVTLRRVPAGR